MLLIEPTTFVAFVAAALAIVMSPGPDTIIVLRYTISSGRGVGAAAVMGVQFGLVGHTILAIVGLSIVIASSPALFTLIAIAGAGYIAWLGVQGIRKGIVRVEGTNSTIGVSHAKALRDAMLTNLLNPKVILVFLALMPNFVDVEHGQVPGQLLILGATLIAINTLWQLPLALPADWIRSLLDQPRFQHIVNWGTGIVLLAIAAMMLVEHVL